MALIKGQFWGDMSGKVGGIVFGRNKAGKTARQYVVPTDAKSGQQVKVRSVFASAVSFWNSISSLTKSQWNTFASTIFKPKRPKGGVSYSGFQAFTSLNAMVNTMNTHNDLALITIPSNTATYIDFSNQVGVPPVLPSSNLIMDGNDVVESLSLTAVTYNSVTGAWTVELGVDPVITATIPVFENPVTEIPIGFALYFSGVLPTGANSVGNYDQFLIGILRHPVFVSNVTAMSSFTFGGIVNNDYLINLKNGFTPGVDVFATVFAISLNGQSSRIGMVRVTLT
jgi:hypothetical protein